MNLDEYQLATDVTAVYPGQGETMGLAYAALGLAGEAGEIANKVKKILRDDNGVLMHDKAQAIADEVGDVLWYLARVAEEVNHRLDGIAQRNIDKLLSRQERGVLQGSGDNR